MSTDGSPLYSVGSPIHSTRCLPDLCPEFVDKFQHPGNIHHLLPGLQLGNTFTRLPEFLNLPAADVVSFLTLLRLSYLTCGPRSTWPVVLKTIVKDSALYFIVVFTSHSAGVLFMTVNTVSAKRSSENVFNLTFNYSPVARLA